MTELMDRARAAAMRKSRKELEAEINRLRSVNAELLAALHEIVRIRDEVLRGTSGTRLSNIARAAIAKAQMNKPDPSPTEEQER